MSPITQGVLIGVLSILLATLIIFILKLPSRLFKKGPKPKIIIKLIKEGSSSSALRDSGCDSKFKLSLELFNNSEHTAFDIKMINSTDNNPFKESKMGDTHLESLDKLKIKTEYFKILNITERQKYNQNPSNYLPEELDKFSLIISYKNNRDKTYYSKYTKNGSEEYCTIHNHKPRL